MAKITCQDERADGTVVRPHDHLAFTLVVRTLPDAALPQQPSEDVDVQPIQAVLRDHGARVRLTNVVKSLVELLTLPSGFRFDELISITWSAGGSGSGTAIELLSAREREVVQRACLGSHNKGIAYDLGLSHSTVRVLMCRAAAKLGVRTRGELLAKLSGTVRTT